MLLVDDSIVRGTTSKARVTSLKEAGAKEVHVLISCPPHRHPCVYGIDFPESGELIASGRDSAEIGRALGADAVVYQELDGLRASIREAALPETSGGSRSENPCTACLDGCYPTDVSIGLKLAEARRKDRGA